ncbi:MAG TPA: PQQ-binding-like beta-propeller repeat protein [Roseiflexaceae bacterium]|nr:PQQ-binding-like beta-propeller repeat protein [Roseiflexaceae bacterium]
MSWQATDIFRGAGAVAFAAATIENRLIFRNLTSITAWRSGQAQFLWATALHGDREGGVKLLDGAGNRIISIIDTGSDSSRKLIVLDPADGKVTWEEPLAVQPVSAGLATIEETIFVYGYRADDKQNYLYGYDSAASSQIFVEAVGPGVGIASAARLLMMAGNAEVRAYDLRGQLLGTVRATLPTLYSRSSDIYVHFYDPDNHQSSEFSWWDGETQSRQGRSIAIDVPERPSVAPGIQRGTAGLILTEGERGVALLDFHTGQVRWRGLRGVEVRGLCATPYGFVAASESDGGVILTSLDTQTGEILERTPARSVAVYQLLWLGERLIVASIAEAELFAWGEQPPRQGSTA